MRAVCGAGGQQKWYPHSRWCWNLWARPFTGGRISDRRRAIELARALQRVARTGAFDLLVDSVRREHGRRARLFPVYFKVPRSPTEGVFGHELNAQITLLAIEGS